MLETDFYVCWCGGEESIALKFTWWLVMLTLSRNLIILLKPIVSNYCAIIFVIFMFSTVFDVVTCEDPSCGAERS